MGLSPLIFKLEYIGGKMKKVKLLGVLGLLVASFSLVGFDISTSQSKVSENHLENLSPTAYTAGRSQKSVCTTCHTK